MALDIVKNLIDRGYLDTKLCMVGPDKDGTMLNFKKKMNQLNLQKHVKITGKISKKDWTSISEEYNFFINTTNIDNNPVSVIEAMSLGLPVITTNVGGIKYLIKDKEDGVLCNINSHEFTNEILYLFKNENFRKRIILNARKKAEKFDWSIVRKSYLKLFNISN